MTYKEFNDNMVAMELKYQRDQDRIFESIHEWECKRDEKEVDEETANTAINNLYSAFEFLKGRHARKHIERLITKRCFMLVVSLSQQIYDFLQYII